MKITITRLLEASKYLATDVGQQIPDFFDYMSELAENVVRALRNGLTFNDNFDGVQRTISLTHNTTQTITLDRTVTGIIPMRVYSTSYGIDSFLWYYDEAGRLTVRCGFSSAPTSALQVSLAIFY